MKDDPINVLSRVYADAIIRLLELLFPQIARVFADVPGFKRLRLSPSEIDHRLSRIDGAREGLREAMEALDELKKTAEQNRDDLMRLNAAIIKAEEQKVFYQSQMEVTKAMAQFDSAQLRETLSIPSNRDVWRERIIAFTLGFLASVLASAIWEYGIKRLIA